MVFVLTERQRQANGILAGPARHILLRGGARSGKTFLIVRALVTRSIKVPGSTHAILRFRFNHLKASIISQTLPSVMSLCYPQVPYETNKSEWFTTFPNKSIILYGGLDDKDRTEKILGQEHSSIFLNEVSQISYASRNKAVTRLAQKSGLKLKAYYDENPPSAAHWSYPLFMRKEDPISRSPLPNPEMYETLQMNPRHNLANLPAGYIQELENLPKRDRDRFLEGEFMSDIPNALWPSQVIERNRCAETQMPPLKRIVVAVDPSGCEGEEDVRSDQIGLVAVGLGIDDVGYVLEDCTDHYSPSGWASKALEMFDLWCADCVVAETNYGGAMVENTIRTSRPNVPIKIVHASRGKVRRAEPVSALYEKNRVKHVGHFPELEEQLMSFSTTGYEGSTSPDRADAAIWGLTELMIGATSKLFVTAL